MRYGSPWTASTGATSSASRMPMGNAAAANTSRIIRQPPRSRLRRARGLVLDDVLEDEQRDGDEEQREREQQAQLARHRAPRLRQQPRRPARGGHPRGGGGGGGRPT